MRFRGIIFNLTYDCTLDCPHCFYYPQATGRGAFELARLREIIEGMEDEAPVLEVHYTGGEPFLYFDRLAEAVELARELGARRITCSTNCYWADDLAEARRMVGRLRDAGLTWFLISADAFHQEGVPIENVAIASRVRVELGLQGNDDLSVVAMVSPDYSHPFNDETLKIAEKVRSWGHGASLHSSMPYGRGHELIPDDVCHMIEPQHRCWEFETWGFIHPGGPRTVIIGPDENVMVCYGISLGNLQEKSLLELLREFDENPNPVVATLLGEGVGGLVQMAEEHGWQRGQAYQNECHLCYHARDYLRQFEPTFLQPNECYPAWAR